MSIEMGQLADRVLARKARADEHGRGLGGVHRAIEHRAEEGQVRRISVEQVVGRGRDVDCEVVVERLDVAELFGGRLEVHEGGLAVDEVVLAVHGGQVVWSERDVCGIAGSSVGWSDWRHQLQSAKHTAELTSSRTQRCCAVAIPMLCRPGKDCKVCETLISEGDLPLPSH